jgi:adenine-specific DNA-methyltransferase
MNLALFPDLVLDCPSAEGVKYAESKLRLLPYILRLAQKVKPRSVFDGFAGTTRVTQGWARL